MTNLPLQLPHGEEMHNDIGLLRSWIVPEPGMTDGFKALHHREPV